jgi:hypothetical protein
VDHPVGGIGSRRSFASAARYHVTMHSKPSPLIGIVPSGAPK